MSPVMEHSSTIEPAMLVAGVLIAIAIGFTRLSVRFGVPALLLFLGTGMLAGTDGIGGIWFNNPALVWSVGVVALAFLLFAGGLDTDARHIRPVLAQGLVLSTVGVAMSTALTAFVYSRAFDRPLAEGVLLGAIVSSTDAAAVFGVLRSVELRLKGRIQALVEMESGSNDPIAIFLTMAATAVLATGGQPPAGGTIAWGLVREMGLGLLAGVLGGRAMSWAILHVRVLQTGLYPVFTAALGMALFGATSLVGGSGFLAIYVAGIVVGSRPMVHRRAILGFHDALAWLAQIAMFVMLGLLVFPSHFPDVAGRGLLISGFLVLIARPFAVLLCLTPFRVPLREQAMIAWVGLRGAVPIVLATWPRMQGVAHSEEIFDIVFFVVVTSVALQGATLPYVARLLDVVESDDSPLAAPRVVRIAVGPGVDGRMLADVGLPPGALVTLLNRGDVVLVPQGTTTFAAGDVAHVLTADVEATERVLGGTAS
jgi:cell volume regulation protein A